MLSQLNQLSLILEILKLKMKRLHRYPDKGFIGGVCFGLGEHTNIDPILWRILAIFGGFIPVYLVLWIFLKKG